MKSPLTGVGGHDLNARSSPGANYGSPERTEHNRSPSYQDDGLTMSQMKNFVLDWIRRPYLINAENYSSNVQLARSIDHLSKTVFTLLFGLFSFFYFLTFAFIKPAQLEDWIEKEFEAID